MKPEVPDLHIQQAAAKCVVFSGSAANSHFNCLTKQSKTIGVCRFRQHLEKNRLHSVSLGTVFVNFFLLNIVAGAAGELEATCSFHQKIRPFRMVKKVFSNHDQNFSQIL